MSVIEADSEEITRSAYAQAWTEFERLPGMSPDERASGPQRLRNHIRVLVDNGERDAHKIAVSAVGMLRETEQIARSKARLMLREI